MQKLLRGIHRFRETTFLEQRELFERLESGQAPDTLFITCSDSRIDPNLLTGSGLGELFTLRNAGNIIPVSLKAGGEVATIEFAVSALKVRSIIVCGHTDCGAMRGLLHPETLQHLPAMHAWLQNGQSTRAIIAEHYAHLGEVEQLRVAAQENVIAQLERITALPCVQARAGEVHLHGWMYKFATAEVFGYDPISEQFLLIEADERREDSEDKRIQNTQKKMESIFFPDQAEVQKKEVLQTH